MYTFILRFDLLNMETSINDTNKQRRTIKVEKQLTMESTAVHDVKPTKSLDVVKV